MEHDVTVGTGSGSSEFYREIQSWQRGGSVLFGAGQGRVHSLLGNMAHCPIEVGNVAAISSESLYQASRFPHNRVLQLEILALDGLAAKRAARSHVEQTAPDWVGRRRLAMFAVLALKLQTPTVADCLLRTGTAPIVEVSRTDAFWGAVAAGDLFRGANVLGRMWMALRSMPEQSRAHTYLWARRCSSELWPLG